VVRGPYPRVVRLHAIAAQHWRIIDGTCAAQGVDPLLLRPDRFCSLIWNWAIQRVEEPEEWAREMDLPLPGTTTSRRRPTPREEDLEADGFMALYAQVNAQ